MRENVALPVVVLLSILALANAGCGRGRDVEAADAAGPETASTDIASPGTTIDPGTADHDARLQAHRDLAHRLRAFPVIRSGGRAGEAAALDERVRLGAFWLARRDLHHFGADFERRAEAIAAMPGETPTADAALRELRATVATRLPDWRALVDYNASGRMREDGGAEGRRLLPHYIVAIDALEREARRYDTTVDHTQ